jgi:hypothetical protein
MSCRSRVGIRSARAARRDVVSGPQGRSVLVVVHGYVKLAAFTAGGGGEVVLDVVAPGGLLGELGDQGCADGHGVDVVSGALDRRARVSRGAGAIDGGNVLDDPPARQAAEQDDSADH